LIVFVNIKLTLKEIHPKIIKTTTEHLIGTSVQRNLHKPFDETSLRYVPSNGLPASPGVLSLSHRRTPGIFHNFFWV